MRRFRYTLCAVFSCLFLAMTGCGWVDSTGAQSEITQLGATGNASDNTIDLIEETEKILDLQNLRSNSGESLATRSWNQIEEGKLLECATFFSLTDAAETVTQACSPDEPQCSLFIANATNVGPENYSLLPPRLSSPVGIKYEWELETASGLVERMDITFCIDTINEPPQAVDDVYSVSSGDTLAVDGFVFNQNCTPASGTNSILENDIDDSDRRAGCWKTELVNAPIAALNNFGQDFNATGGFIYRHNSASNATEDRFRYKIFDGEHYSGVATVVISIKEESLAPVPSDDQYSVRRNSSDNVFFPMSNDVDPLSTDIDLLRIEVPPSAGGTATIAGTNRVVYTPKRGFRGTETLQYTIINAAGQLGTATISIRVL